MNNTVMTSDDIADRKDILAYYKNDNMFYVSFKLKKSQMGKVFYNYNIINRIKGEKVKVPMFRDFFEKNNLCRDELEILLFFADNNKTC